MSDRCAVLFLSKVKWVRGAWCCVVPHDITCNVMSPDNWGFLNKHIENHSPAASSSGSNSGSQQKTKANKLSDGVWVCRREVSYTHNSNWINLLFGSCIFAIVRVHGSCIGRNENWYTPTNLSLLRSAPASDDRLPIFIEEMLCRLPCPFARFVYICPATR